MFAFWQRHQATQYISKILALYATLGVYAQQTL